MLMSARDVTGLVPQARAIDTALRRHGCWPAMLAHGDPRQVGRWGSWAIERLDGWAVGLSGRRVEHRLGLSFRSVLT